MSTIYKDLNVFARSWDGEPSGEPRHHPARTEPRPPKFGGPGFWEGEAPAEPRRPLPAPKFGGPGFGRAKLPQIRGGLCRLGRSLALPELRTAI
jgi:hypothetical protein